METKAKAHKGIDLKIHGYDVVAIAALPDASGLKAGRHVVLVDRGEEPAQRTRWVVAVWVVGEEGWHSGDYRREHSDAMAAFMQRWERGL